MDKTPILTYRPDIDGLRAIAVISVVLFHLDKRLIPGGFVGVDIFFVISGYLITLISYRQMRDGSFTFFDFYRRRINRIIPALSVLIAAVLMAGLVLVSPADLVKLSKGALAAIAAVSNIYFWREYGNYFNGGINEAPLLHTWSLGVEEQFYFIWPVILFWIARVKGGLKVLMVGAGLAAAVLISEVGTRTAASASYYLLPTRFFELAIGSSLAIFVFERGTPFGYLRSTLCGIVGLVLMFGSLMFLSESASFPGINALYPCAGTALLIAAGADARSFPARALSVKPLILIGRISYSLYLWHWPLIAYANYLDIPITLYSGAIIFSTSIMLAWLSWKFVEMPFRRSGAVMTFSKAAIKRYVAPCTAIALTSVVVTKSDGFPGRFDPRVMAYEKIIGAAPETLYKLCHSQTFYYQREPHPSCLIGASSRKAGVFLIGDSYANHFTGMVDVLAKQDRLTVMHYTMDGCLPVKGLGFGTLASYIEKCRSRNGLSYRFIASHHFEYVILGGSWPNDGTPESFEKLQQGLRVSISSIIASGAKPVIILSNQATHSADCPVRRLLIGRSNNCENPPQNNVMQWRMFQALKHEFSEIIFIDPNKVICRQGRCQSIIGQVPLYRDSGHLNDIGSRLIGTMLVESGIRLTHGDASPSLFESATR